MEDQPTNSTHKSQLEQRVRVRYAILTVALFAPLSLAFFSIRNLYPVGASTMMVGLKDTRSSRDYYLLRGETISGETIDLPPIELTNGLTGRNWSLAGTAVENKSFNIRTPYPANTLLAQNYGGNDKLPRAALLEDLLRAWGGIYNSRLPESSTQKLKAIKLDVYHWEGGLNGEYARFVESWRTAL